MSDSAAKRIGGWNRDGSRWISEMHPKAIPQPQDSPTWPSNHSAWECPGCGQWWRGLMWGRACPDCGVVRLANLTPDTYSTDS